MFVLLAPFSLGLLVPLSPKYASVLPGSVLHERFSLHAGAGISTTSLAANDTPDFAGISTTSLLANANTPDFDAPGLSLDALVATLAPLALLVALVLGAKSAWNIFSKQF